MVYENLSLLTPITFFINNVNYRYRQSYIYYLTHQKVLCYRKVRILLSIHWQVENYYNSDLLFYL
jgi:hypothetical protein